MVKKINKLLNFYTRAQIAVLLGYSNRSSLSFILSGRNKLPIHKYGIINNLLDETSKGVVRKVNPNYKLENRTKRAWRAMLYRCDIGEYVEKKIKICKEWRSYENFLKDMGLAPDNASIERIDNSKGYSKSNCKWATYDQQNSNKSNIRLFNFEGELLTKSEIRRRLTASNA